MPKRLASLTIALSLIIGVLVACEPKSRDEKITFGDGSVVVHVPAASTKIGIAVLPGLYRRSEEPIKQGWSAAADKFHFVAIYPFRGGSWNAGLCCGNAAATQRDDVAWLTNAIFSTGLKYGLDTIWLAGDSNGGMMVERLVAEAPWLSSRFAVWGGAPEMVTAGKWAGVGTVFDGTKDKTVPYRGGRSIIAGLNVTIRPALTTARWLIGSHLKGVVVKGQGHTAQPGWPALALRSFGLMH